MGHAGERIWPVRLSAVWDYSQFPWIREQWLLLQKSLTECAKHRECITKQMGKIHALSLWISGEETLSISSQRNETSALEPSTQTVVQVPGSLVEMQNLNSDPLNHRFPQFNKIPG